MTRNIILRLLDDSNYWLHVIPRLTFLLLYPMNKHNDNNNQTNNYR